jgi:hypothetical protein
VRKDGGTRALPAPRRVEGEEKYLLEARVTEALAPADAIEEFWVEDVVHHIGETRRLRDLRDRLLTSSIYLGLRELVAEQVGSAVAGPLVSRWSRRQPKARARVSAILSRAGLTMADALARTVELKLDSVERLDRMIANFEARRHLVLREFDRHASALAARPRTLPEPIEDASYAEVPHEARPTGGPR